MYLEKIDRLLGEWREEYIQMLRRWVSIESVAGASAGEGMPFGRANREMLDMALRDAAAMGFETENFRGYAGHAQMGEGEQTMGILAHLDVVPLGSGWTRDPLGGEIEGGYLYARGASDNKGPALAALFAMRAVKESGLPLRHAVRLILGCDEEVGMSDIRHYASVQKMPDYGFSPDAGYPLINIEKGGMKLTLTAEVHGEAGCLPIDSIDAGERMNIVPSSASAEIGIGAKSICDLRASLAELNMDVEITGLGNGRAKLCARGKSAHGASPADGVNAAGMLLLALRHLGADGAAGDTISLLAEKLGMAYDGAALGIAHSDELSGDLTCNLGILRFSGNRLYAELDIRYPIGSDEVAICGNICVALSGAKIAVARNDGRPVHHMPKDHHVVKTLLDVYARVTGLEPYTIAMGGATYARLMPQSVAFGSAFPDREPCNIHAPDERVNLDDILLSARVMARAIAALAGEGGGAA